MSNRFTRTVPAYWRLLRPHRSLFWGVVCASFAVVATEALSVGILLPLVEHGGAISGPSGGAGVLEPAARWLGSMDLVDRIRAMAMLLVLVIALRMAMLSLFNYLGIELRLRLVLTLQRQAIEQLLAVQLAWVGRRRLGELDEILAHHISQVGTMVDQATRAVGLLATLAVYGLLMLWLAPVLALISAALLLGLLTLVWFGIALPLEVRSGRTRQSAVMLHSFLLETLAGLRTIHVFGAQQRRLERFAALQDEHFRNRGAVERQVAVVRPAFEVANMLTLGFLLFVASWLLPTDPEPGTGRLIVFVAIVLRLTSPTAEFVHAIAVMIRNEPALRAVQGFLAREGKPYPARGSVPFSEMREGLRFEHVSFRYSSDEPAVLDELDLSVPAGRFTAVVGASGAGKSTFVNLVARVADCSSGRITVDGVDLRDLDCAAWQSRLAVVSQDVFLFNDTVAENIRFARPDADDASVRWAATTAGAAEFIEGLPDGYLTQLGDRGTRLSGGQRQRIALARALVAGPSLLILDEATSELDAVSERAVKEELSKLCPRWTIVSIAHRLSSIRDADNILVLDRGRLVEQGSHGQLSEIGGYYQRMIEAETESTAERLEKHQQGRPAE